MEKDYEVVELQNAGPSEARYEVSPILEDDPLARALIETGALEGIGNLRFTVIGDQSCVIFRTRSPTVYDIYPKPGQAKKVFVSMINEALIGKQEAQALEEYDFIEDENGNLFLKHQSRR